MLCWWYCPCYRGSCGTSAEAIGELEQEYLNGSDIAKRWGPRRIRVLLLPHCNVIFYPIKTEFGIFTKFKSLVMHKTTLKILWQHIVIKACWSNLHSALFCHAVSSNTGDLNTPQNILNQFVGFAVDLWHQLWCIKHFATSCTPDRWDSCVIPNPTKAGVKLHRAA